MPRSAVGSPPLLNLTLAAWYSVEQPPTVPNLSSMPLRAADGQLYEQMIAAAAEAEEVSTSLAAPISSAMRVSCADAIALHWTLQ